MKKRIRAFLTAFVMTCIFLTSFLGNAVTARAGNLTLKLHYEREDGNYADWSVWLWVEGADSLDAPLIEENGEMVATYPVIPGASEVGFIVRTPEWKKDVDMDQFIDITECVSGTVHVYVKSGMEGYTIEYGEDVVSGIKIANAIYDGTHIKVTMAGSLEEGTETFSVVSKDGAEVPVASVSGKGAIFTIETTEPLDISKAYTIMCGGSSYDIIMPDYYATSEFEEAYTYIGNDLGANWTKDFTTFRIWAPTAETVSVNLYKSGDSAADDFMEAIPMTADVNGTWVAKKSGDLNGIYYTYTSTVNGKEAEQR